MILGLDASTSVVGWCLLNKDGSYCDIGYLNLHKYIGLYEKLDEFEALVDKLFKHKISHIYVEEPVKMFKSNFSMAQVISILQRWNGMISAVLYDWTDLEPKLVNAMTARSTCGIKVPRGTNAKECVLQHVMERGIIPESKWEEKRTGNYKDYCYDMADAWVVANTGVIIEKRNI